MDYKTESSDFILQVWLNVFIWPNISLSSEDCT